MAGEAAAVLPKSTNDAATVSSDSKSVSEGDTASALNTSGQLTITDPDTGEAHVVAQSSFAGTYGSFTIDANGAWTTRQSVPKTSSWSSASYAPDAVLRVPISSGLSRSLAARSVTTKPPSSARAKSPP